MLLGQSVRNGVVEVDHHGAVAVWGRTGLEYWGGDIDRRYYSRSAAKPFQLAAALSSGVVLSAQERAIGASSHGGFPTHLAYVRKILNAAGLAESALQTPASWPNHLSARDLLIAHGETLPRPIYNNCSGKHAVWLAACVAAGWDTATYLDTLHPLQLKIREVMSDVSDSDVGPSGVDGCGAPVWQISTKSLSRAFFRLGNDPTFSDVWIAMHTYPALTSGNGRIDQQVATVLPAAAKMGAEACLGVAISGSYGIGVKCWDGSMRGLESGILGTLNALGMEAASKSITEGTETRQVVLGGGRPQGTVVPAVRLATNRHAT